METINNEQKIYFYNRGNLQSYVPLTTASRIHYDTQLTRHPRWHQIQRPQHVAPFLFTKRRYPFTATYIASKGIYFRTMAAF